MDVNQLVTSSEAARVKGMTLNQFLYYYKKGRTPPATFIGVFRHVFFELGAIEGWQPVKYKTGTRKHDALR